MTPRISVVIALLLSAPLGAQAASRVDQLGFTFQIEAKAFRGVEAAMAKRWTDADNGEDLPDPAAPAHAVFTLHPVPAAYVKPGARPYLDGNLELIPLSDATVQDFAKAYSDLVATAAEVRVALKSRPGHPALHTNLPEWALIDAEQSFHAKVEVIESPWCSGLAYLTQEVQDDGPITNAVLFVFQGVSRDGRWFISLKAPVTNPVLEGSEPEVDWNSPSATKAYLQRMEARLDQAPDASYSPSLSGLLGLVRSLHPSNPPR